MTPPLPPHESPTPQREDSLRQREPKPFSEAMPLYDHMVDLHCREQTFLGPRVRWLHKLLLVIFVVLMVALLFLPWRQFIRGHGKVTAFNPLERTVTVEAPLSGRVKEVQIVEGQKVEKGDLLLRLEDNDPSLMANLKAQHQDLENQRKAARSKLSRLKTRIERIRDSIPQALEVADQKIEIARATKLAAEEQWERINALYEDPRGLASQRQWELARMSKDGKQAEWLQSKSERLQTEFQLNADLEKVNAEADEAQATVAKIDKELRMLTIKINQTGRQEVTAPRSGHVFRVRATEGSYIKGGSALCTIIPETDEFVVELWIDGNDMPLVQERIISPEGKVTKPGSPVRIQFEGWPAIQFVGWPNVAQGTFGGEIIFVDRTDNGQGLFRTLVAPDPDPILDASQKGGNIEWPTSPVMRQGIQAQGWILLEQVPLWFEVWRQINGFPPALNKESEVGKQVRGRKK